MLLQARVLWPEPQFCRGTTGEDGPDGRSHDVADEKLAELWNGCTQLVFVEYAPRARWLPELVRLDTGTGTDADSR